MEVLTIWATLNGAAVGDGPLFAATTADLVLTELNQFNKSSVTLAASHERAILAMQPFTLLEVVQEGVGTLLFGYVLNPRQQITDRDEDTITLELEPLTAELSWRHTHRGWTAANFLTVVAKRLVSLAPGWTCDPSLVGFGAGGDFPVSVSLDNPTILDGFLSTTVQFGQFARLGVDSTGAPTRTLEMGTFGFAPTVTLTDPKGGDPDALAANPTIRLVATVDRQPNDVHNLINVCTPFGGGSGDTLVTLERLWRIVNDPGYVNFGLYGNVPGTVFPEYDPAYPISDPENPATGAATWFTTLPGTSIPVPLPAGHTVAVGARRADGTVPLIEHDATGAVVVGAMPALSQGAVGTRFFTPDGHDDYMVYDQASYFGTATTPAYGHKEGPFNDAGLTYADNSPANQEETARALYLSCIANFKRFAHPHHSFTCTANDASGRPTRAGDLIAVDYGRVTSGDDGAVVEMNVQENLRVMRVVRHFTDTAPPVDEYTLSNLGRFDEDDPTGAVSTARQMVALQIRQDTSLAPAFLWAAGNVDALTPLTVPVAIPKQLFRWQKCSLRVDFLPFTGTSVTAVNQEQDFQIVTPGSDIELPLPSDLNLGGTFNAAGTGATGTTDGFDLVQTGVDNDAVVQLIVSNDGGTQPLGQRLNAELVTTGGGARWRLSSGAVPDGTPVGANMKINFPKAKTASPFTAPINKLVAAAKSVLAHIPAQTILAVLPKHTHPVDQRVPPNGPVAPSCTVSINGVALTSGLALTSGSRDPLTGAFTSSFEVDDISQFIQTPGQTVTLTFASSTSSGNPYGAGRFQASGTWFGEWGGLSSTVRAV